MDVKYVNPFIESFQAVMPQLGFNEISIGKLSAKSKEVNCNGVVIVLGLLGGIRGNVVYTMQTEDAKKIASTMMMGMPVEEFDEMAGSALSELTNMLTANAATLFCNLGITVEISTPTMLQGETMSVKMVSDQILCVQLVADGISIDINLSFVD